MAIEVTPIEKLLSRRAYLQQLLLVNSWKFGRETEMQQTLNNCLEFRLKNLFFYHTVSLKKYIDTSSSNIGIIPACHNKNEYKNLNEIMCILLHCQEAPNHHHWVTKHDWLARDYV